MSHTKERKEKSCLNCNAVIYGTYCHICGQQNTEPKDTFGHLAAHLISDIFHFDGKFFSSAKYLLFRPGFLTYEYVRGRRASYLNPIKMYVFISAVFFIFFLTVYKPEQLLSRPENQKVTTAGVMKELTDQKEDITASLANKDIPVSAKNILQETLKKIQDQTQQLQRDSSKKNEIHAALTRGIIISAYNSFSLLQYDSMQRILPAAKRDGWLMRQFNRRGIIVNEKFKGREDTMLEQLLEAFFHHFPQVLFISLPLFALLLQLLYIRRRKWYYVDHLIYTVHLYCAVFIFLFLLLVISAVNNAYHLQWLIYFSNIIWIYILYYTYKGLRNFYGQGRGKTILKWLLLNATAMIFMIFLFGIYLIFTAFTL